MILVVLDLWRRVVSIVVEGNDFVQEEAMRASLICAAVIMTLAGAGGRAEAAAWCAWYDHWTYNCGFHTFQQCLDTISGVGGWCSRNHYEETVTPRDEPRPRHRKRAHKAE